MVAILDPSQIFGAPVDLKIVLAVHVLSCQNEKAA